MYAAMEVDSDSDPDFQFEENVVDAEFFLDDGIEARNNRPVEPKWIQALDVNREPGSSSRIRGVQAFQESIELEPDNFKKFSYLNLCGKRYFSRVASKFPIANRVMKNRVKSLRRVYMGYIRRDYSVIFRETIEEKMRKNENLRYYMRKYVTHCRTSGYEVNTELAKQFCVTVIPLLEFNEETDAKLIVDFVKIVFRTQESRNFFLFQSITVNSSIDYVLGQAMKAKWDVWGYLSDNLQYDSYPICPLMAAFFHGNRQRISILLKYGFRRVTAKTIAEFHRLGHENPVYNMCGVIPWIQQQGLPISAPEIDLDLYRLQRIFLMIEVVFTLFKTRVDCRNWQKCYTLIWRVMREPTVTYEEFYSILPTLGALPRRYARDEDIRELVSYLALRYLTKFKKLPENIITPRSLADQCRNLIRDNLRRNFQLPDGVTAMCGNGQAPSDVEQFLLLKL